MFFFSKDISKDKPCGAGQGGGENAISTWSLAAKPQFPEIAATIFQKRCATKLTAAYLEFPLQNTWGDPNCRPQTHQTARGQN